MKHIVTIVVVLALFTPSVFADTSKTYQVTGPIVSMTEHAIVIKKDDGNWEIARSDKTNVKGKLKVGAKVTVKYRMTATRIEVK